jgi:hypothetical protein
VRLRVADSASHWRLEPQANLLIRRGFETSMGRRWGVENAALSPRDFFNGLLWLSLLPVKTRMYASAIYAGFLGSNPCPKSRLRIVEWVSSNTSRINQRARTGDAYAKPCTRRRRAPRDVNARCWTRSSVRSRSWISRARAPTRVARVVPPVRNTTAWIRRRSLRSPRRLVRAKPAAQLKKRYFRMARRAAKPSRQEIFLPSLKSRPE